MNFRRHTARFLFLLMLGTQLLLAHHAAAHGLEHQQENHCQVCLVGHDFGKTLTASAPVITAPVFAGADLPAAAVHLCAQHIPSFYGARAPPSFSA